MSQKSVNTELGPVVRAANSASPAWFLWAGYHRSKLAVSCLTGRLLALAATYSLVAHCCKFLVRLRLTDPRRAGWSLMSDSAFLGCLPSGTLSSSDLQAARRSGSNTLSAPCRACCMVCVSYTSDCPAFTAASLGQRRFCLCLLGTGKGIALFSQCWFPFLVIVSCTVLVIQLLFFPAEESGRSACKRR